MSNSSKMQCPNDEIVFDELPKARFWGSSDIVQMEGFWYAPKLLQHALTFTSTFIARNDDVFLASTMKTGTTWLKSLSLCIMKNLDNSEVDMLTLENPHSLVPTVEAHFSIEPPKLDIYDNVAPRLLHTHLPYSMLPCSVKNSDCKIVYVARNPKDTLVSLWHFYNSYYKADQEPVPLDQAIDCFCSGMHPYGPFVDHVAEYWLESLRRPEKILFIKCEELKTDAKANIRTIAEFLGKPLKEGEVDEILWRCSLERMKNLEVTKSGTSFSSVPNSIFFRKGEVGDWNNYLTSEMEEQIHESIGRKLEALGLFL